MNVKQAKEQVKNAVTAYLTKDDLGRYMMDASRQRPIFLMGPPGIGKTAIVQQVAEELGIALISYSMTHHTRQSALGLPRIKQAVYQGEEYSVSEYTMSEIISSVYEMIESTGMKNGILFLDEINCVSETLTPIMLQFLQFKTFGMHSVPEGWIVVTAGNPPEYNNSVHEFDIVTWDRLKRVDVEPDFEVWKEYAYATGVHAAVITYLENKRSCFYSVKTTVDGKEFVTARGWDDLSRMLQLYEKNNIAVDELLIRQYLQNPRIAKEFAIYYDLWKKYRSDYQIGDILKGKAGEDIKQRAVQAKFDERYSLMGLLLDALMENMRSCMETHDMLKDLMQCLRSCKSCKTKETMQDKLNGIIGEKEMMYNSGRKSRNISDTEQRRLLLLISILKEDEQLIAKSDEGGKPFEILKKDFDARVKEHMKKAEKTNKYLSNVFDFCDEVFPNGQELLILVVELAANTHSARFLGKFHNDDYFKHDREMLFHERHKEIFNEIDTLLLDE